MAYEQPPDPEPIKEHIGNKYLKLLGLGHLADMPIPGRDGLLYGDFLEICGPHALPVLNGLAEMNPRDPRYDKAISGLRREVMGHIVQPPKG